MLSVIDYQLYINGRLFTHEKDNKVWFILSFHYLFQTKRCIKHISILQNKQ